MKYCLTWKTSVLKEKSIKYLKSSIKDENFVQSLCWKIEKLQVVALILFINTFRVFVVPVSLTNRDDICATCKICNISVCCCKNLVLKRSRGLQNVEDNWVEFLMLLQDLLEIKFWVVCALRLYVRRWSFLSSVCICHVLLTTCVMCRVLLTTLWWYWRLLKFAKGITNNRPLGW